MELSNKKTFDPLYSKFEDLYRRNNAIHYYLKKNDIVTALAEIRRGTSPFIRDECNRTSLDLAIVLFMRKFKEYMCTSFIVECIYKKRNKKANEINIINENKINHDENLYYYLNYSGLNKNIDNVSYDLNYFDNDVDFLLLQKKTKYFPILIKSNSNYDCLKYDSNEKRPKKYTNDKLLLFEEVITIPMQKNIQTQLNDILKKMNALLLFIKTLNKNILLKKYSEKVLAEEISNISFPLFYNYVISSLFKLFPYNHINGKWNIKNPADSRRLINTVLSNNLIGNEIIKFIGKNLLYFSNILQLYNENVFVLDSFISQCFLHMSFTFDNEFLFNLIINKANVFDTIDLFDWNELLRSLYPYRKNFKPYYKPLLYARLRKKFIDRLEENKKLKQLKQLKQLKDEKKKSKKKISFEDQESSDENVSSDSYTTNTPKKNISKDKHKEKKLSKVILMDIKNNVKKKLSKGTLKNSKKQTEKIKIKEILKNANEEIKKQISKEILKDTTKEIENKLFKDIKKETNNKLIKNIKKEKENKLFKDIKKETENKLFKDIKKETENKLFKDIKKETENKLLKDIKKEVNDKLIKDVEEQNNNNLIKDIKKETEKILFKNILKNTKEEIKKQLSKEMFIDTKKETKNDLYKNILKNTKKEIKKQLSKELLKDTKQETENNLYKNILKNTKKEIKKQLSKELLKDVKQETENFPSNNNLTLKNVKKEIIKKLSKEIFKNIKKEAEKKESNNNLNLKHVKKEIYKKLSKDIFKDIKKETKLFNKNMSILKNVKKEPENVSSNNILNLKNVNKEPEKLSSNNFLNLKSVKEIEKKLSKDILKDIKKEPGKLPAFKFINLKNVKNEKTKSLSNNILNLKNVKLETKKLFNKNILILKKPSK